MVMTRVLVPVDAHSRPFPKTVVRDLLGLVRILYRAEQDVDMPDS